MESDALHGARLVGHRVRAAAPERFHQESITKHLGCLGLPERFPALGRDHPRLAVSPFERIRKRDRKQPSGVVVADFGDEAVDGGGAHARPRGIVHEHPVVAAQGVASGEQPVIDARRAGLSAAIERLHRRAEFDRALQAKARIPRREHDEDLRNLRMACKLAQGVVQQGMSTDPQILLGRVSPDARAAAGGRNER